MSSFQQNVIKHKIGLLNLAAELGNVSRACKVMGFSRGTCRLAYLVDMSRLLRSVHGVGTRF